MKFKTYLAVGVIAVLGLFSSCGEKIYEGDTIINEGGNADIQKINFTIHAEDWIWNTTTKRYEINFTDVVEISPNVFDKGAIIAYLYNIEGSAILPFIQTVDNKGASYTRIISYDMIDNEIGFFIEDSNRQQNSISDYEFKVVIVQERIKK